MLNSKKCKFLVEFVETFLGFYWFIFKPKKVNPYL